MSESPIPADDLVRAWIRAACRPNVDDALRETFDTVTSAITERQPVCAASGRCCHFDQFGHRLYVTGLEAAWTLTQSGVIPNQAEVQSALDAGTCPYLIDEQCSVHTVKPLGCRVFFCDASTREWQDELYERMHRAIRQLHQRFSIPYEYTEWRTMLKRFAARRNELKGVRDRRNGRSASQQVSSPGRFVPLRISET